MSSGARIGVDLGGTKIEAIALDRDGRVQFRRRVATPAGNYEATIAAVADLVRSAGSDTAPPVGVGIPGTISPATGLVKNANSTCLIGRPLDKDLTAALGRPVRLANDADCFALSEAIDGAGAGASIVFGIILGTGVGGGLVIDRKVIRGPNAITGEWGHNPLPWPAADEQPGPRCYCGRQGCIETFLSGPALARDYDPSGDLTAEAIATRASQGEATATTSLARYMDRLARATASVINILDPDVIVVGGGLSQISEIYSAVPKLWPRRVFSDSVATRLVPPHHGDASGARGAAWLWP